MEIVIKSSNQTDSEQKLDIVLDKETQDGGLYEPRIKSNSDNTKPCAKAVAINVNHDFYKKVYKAHYDDNRVIQALDYVLWTLGMAEINHASQIS